MKNTATVKKDILHFQLHTLSVFHQEAKALLGQQILGDTRQETKRRQASASAKKAPAKAKKAKPARKPALKRLGTMAKTAKVIYSFFL